MVGVDIKGIEEEGRWVDLIKNCKAIWRIISVPPGLISVYKRKGKSQDD